MSINYKVLGQVIPSIANTDVDLYTVPASTSAVCSTLAVCNHSSGATYQIAIRPAGQTIEAKHYIIYDAPISLNDTAFLTLGITLEATDVITVNSSSTNVSFSLFGSEIS